ncbi:unnamed protein product [Sympodiomycopsis kandeliae]
MAHLNQLPSEVLIKILVLLHPRSLVCCQRLNEKIRKIASSDHVLQIVCLRHGMIPEGESLEDQRKSISETLDDPAFKDMTYPAYHVQGRKDKDYKDYQSFLSSTFLLRHMKLKGDLSYYGGSQWSSLTEEPSKVRIDHLNNFMVCTPLRGEAFVFYDLDTGKYLRTINDAHVDDGADFEVSHGWIVHSAPDMNADELYTFKVCKVGTETQTNSDGESIRLPVLQSRGRIVLRDCPVACCFKLPLLAVASADQYVTFYNVVTKEVTQTILVPSSLAGSIDLQFVEFDDEFMWVICVYDDEETNTVRSSVRAYRRQQGDQVWELFLDDEILRKEIYSVESSTQGLQMTGRMDCRLQIQQNPPVSGHPWDTWRSVQIDHTTDSLCLLSDSGFYIVTDHERFFAPDNGHQAV